MKLLFKTSIHLPVEKVKEGFNQELFVYLSPPGIPFKLERFDGCSEGNEVHIQLGLKPLTQNWISLITSEVHNSQGWSFIDEGKVLPWPLSYWKHHHRVDKISESESLIVDDITFRCRPGFLTPLMKPFLWGVFCLRPKRYKTFFKV